MSPIHHVFCWDFGMQNSFTFSLLFLVVSSFPNANAQLTSDPIVSAEFIAEEIDGVVAVEAEHFVSQEKAGVRAFHVTTPTQHPRADSDGDNPHWIGASGNAYVEVLPDTRRNHGEPLKACLLYTSPSPRDRQKSRMPSSA